MLESTMQSYKPPHLRRPQAQLSGQPSASSTAPSRIINKPRYGPTASSSSLAAPASDLKPMRPRAASTEQDMLGNIQSVSRSGGDGAEGDASRTKASLKDWKTQERYRRYIDQRIQKHYTTHSTPRHQPPNFANTEEMESLQSIVLLFLFESSVRFCILAKNTGQLLSALSGLVPGLYLAVDSTRRKGKSKQQDSSALDNLADRISKIDLDSSSRRDAREEFASLLLLFHLVQDASSSTNFHSTLMELTNHQSRRLRTPFTHSQLNSIPPTQPQDPFLLRSALAYSIRAYHAVSVEHFSPLAYYALLDNPSASPYEKMILSWVESGIRERVWEVLKKTVIKWRAVD
ncbi:hypothetical protein TREMEDRAFT_65330 [Tremella mesenterica DSM 1558]|uniref:uncharacterized protein n=1 Tax=Tremella mesenterica (strain ATCC 24925 / CBS 8224 / DSM 1558 / NBRC 9311 / NRRL Y-6157 / RJB 2259-6 / UBC 559-6) TaxID=578456 RepID=UPI00032BE566|nr:uncharacterized protein TREMEDRAFT_65330 [Tremella mesenterica DSM 1558]EIW66468.1 hypothetical protein TREMEDRAFT_65330 [Tremella mesenterica DSM 1558]